MQTLPDCFGQHWSANALECTGGLDPNYRDKVTGSQRRERCGWYTQCAQRVNAARLAQQPQVGGQQVIPVNSVRQAAQPAPPVQWSSRPLVPTGGYSSTPWSPPAAPAQPQQQIAPAGWAPPHIAYQGPQYVPVLYQQPGAQMPGYLAIPEPVTDDVSWLHRLVHEIIRAVFKASGHTLASYFDHNVISKPRPPSQTTPQPPKAS